MVIRVLISCTLSLRSNMSTMFIITKVPAPAVTAPACPRGPAPGFQCQPHMHAEWSESSHGCHLHLESLRWEGRHSGDPST